MKRESDIILIRNSVSFVAFLLVTSCGCITNMTTKKSNSPEVPPSADQDVLAGTRVGARFQRNMLDLFMSDPAYTNAYGLFTEGGWSNAGQIWVLANENFSQVKIFKAAPNKDEVSEVSVNREALTSLQKALPEAKELKSVEETMFDGLIYEFTALTKDGSVAQLQSNIYIKSTDLTKHPRHGALVEAFSAL